MANKNWDHDEEARLAEYLVARVSGKATGNSELECLKNYPRDVYFIGNLRPSQNEQLGVEGEPRHFREILNKLAPVAFGAEFLLAPNSESVEVIITARWACYYRIFPTYEQQREHQNQNGSATRANGIEINSASGAQLIQIEDANDDNIETEEDEHEDRVSETGSSEVVDSSHDRHISRRARDSIFVRFRKIYCQATERVFLRLEQHASWSLDTENFQDALNQEMRRAQQVVLNDPDHLRTTGSVDTKVTVPDDVLESKSAYEVFFKTLTIDVVPEWRWEIRSEVRDLSEVNLTQKAISIEFVNSSPMHGDSPNLESFIFDTEALFTFPGKEVKPFELDLVPRGFRYKKELWGQGINCAVKLHANENSTLSFLTTHTPIYHQMRFTTRTNPPAKFRDLAQDPMPVLDRILQEMEQYLQIWEHQRQRYINSDPDWEERYGGEFVRDRQVFEQEIFQFRRGCELIRKDEDVRAAFQLTNETFSRGQKTEWRLFQIVFLVIQTSGISALSNTDESNTVERERVDIIYFPTGGGKTEAYLATIIFHCFYDRLRGKAAGVTAWTRFPLRLLTLQQTQRVVDVIGAAELVRRGQSDSRLSGKGIDGFAVGYFVGEGGSPNKILDPQKYRYANAEEQVIWSKVNDPNVRQGWKRIIHCPACRTSTVQVNFDSNSTRLIHCCTNKDCAFPGGELPIYVVDTEIYRYLPCVIVGTIDKLAGLGNQRMFALLFGQVDGKCPQHGYYKGRCCQKDCAGLKELNSKRPAGISGPTLFIQDELHLLKEGLGTFDAHYETFSQQLRREFGQTEPLKIIASSATIEAFERQVNHLYGRSMEHANVFPGLGPTNGQSFYAETLAHPQRLFVGVISHNKTIFNTILELIELYHREVQELQHIAMDTPNPYGGALKPGTPAWKELLDFYITSLTYFLASRELNSIRTDLEGDVVPNLRRDGFLPLEVSELTGSTSTDDVSRILAKLEQVTPPDGLPDAILATSMVSHGVDVDRLNAMIFYGIPRQNAEYIQASSRVGRSHVGIVFTCFHPVRERDQSHYSYFLKYHEFLGQLVEPVAINRWSKFSINRTLPGLFMGVLLQLLANQSGQRNPSSYYMLDFVKGRISDGTLTEEHFIPLLERAYGVQAPLTSGQSDFKDYISRNVRQYLNWILSAKSGEMFVSGVLIPQPMRSLRDVDEAITIELDTLGSHWASSPID